MNRKKWIAAGVIVALIAVPVALKLSRADSNKSVDVEQVSLRALTPTVLASGSLTYESQVTLAPEVTGRVQQILVEEGDQVRRDQLLMRLDPKLPQAAIEQSKAQVRQARLRIERSQVDFDAQLTKLKRYEALKANGMVDANSLQELSSARDLAEVDLRTSREQLSQSEAQLRQAEEQLAKTEIRSPLDGKVTAIYVKVGQTAVPSFSGIAGSVLVDVADTASIDAEINVDETDIANVKVGAEARVVPAAFPDKTLSGKVDQVAIAQPPIPHPFTVDNRQRLGTRSEQKSFASLECDLQVAFPDAVFIEGQAGSHLAAKDKRKTADHNIVARLFTGKDLELNHKPRPG